MSSWWYVTLSHVFKDCASSTLFSGLFPYLERGRERLDHGQQCYYWINKYAYRASTNHNGMLLWPISIRNWFRSHDVFLLLELFPFLATVVERSLDDRVFDGIVRMPLKSHNNDCDYHNAINYPSFRNVFACYVISSVQILSRCESAHWLPFFCYRFLEECLWI